MYLLIRLISPYTEANLLLGVFRTRNDVQVARTQYIAQYQDGRKEDPWKKQGYKDEVNLNDDVIVLDDIPVMGVNQNAVEVYVVSNYAEGFGQIIRKFDAICGSEESALATVSDIKAKLDDNFPEYCKVDKIVVGKLLSDNQVTNYSDLI